MKRKHKLKLLSYIYSQIVYAAKLNVRPDNKIDSFSCNFYLKNKEEIDFLHSLLIKFDNELRSGIDNSIQD